MEMSIKIIVPTSGKMKFAVWVNICIKGTLNDS